MGISEPRILIVDDDPISLATLVHYLSPIATILTAENGQAAIHEINTWLPDLIILDVLMPGLSGFDVCRYVKARERLGFIPIIFVTSVDNVAAKMSGFNAGAVDYITKPFLCDEVKSRVETHLDLYFLRKDLEVRVLLRTNELNDANRALTKETSERQSAQQNLQVLNAELEGRVAERTSELQEAYTHMESRVAERTAELTASLRVIQDANRRIQRAEKLASLGALAGGIAHEINTPIQFIGDNLSFLQSAITELKPILDSFKDGPASHSGAEDASSVEYLTAEMAQAIQESLDGVGRVRDIVQAVKMFAHPGTVTLMPQSPAKVVETAVSVSRNSWKHLADLSVHIEPDLPEVPCHGSDIDQVLLALILNAVDAIEARDTAGRGHIDVGVRKVGQNIEFSVTDDGCGIPDDIRPLIWDLFFTTKEIGKGTGQGLAICHNIIVVKHGGMIDCFCINDKYTRFFFTLPLVAASTVS